MRFTFLASSLLAASSAALAQSVIVVDDDPGPGVQFTDLQVAINLANPGDRIAVRHGTYGDAYVSKPLTIMGEPFVDHHSGPAANISLLNVYGLDPGETVVVTDLRADTLRTAATNGVTILDRMDANYVFVNNSTDVRLHDISVQQPQATQELCAISVLNDSFVQIVGSTFQPRTLPAGGGSAGTNGLRVGGGATVLLNGCNIFGGPGSSSTNCSVPAGTGGRAIYTQQSTVQIVSSTVAGGAGGADCNGMPAPQGPSIWSSTSTVLTSESQLTGGTLASHPIVDVPGLPAMLMDGSARPGDVITFGARMGGGWSARLFLGRRAVIDPLWNIEVPLLHSAERAISLGAFPVGGQRTFPFTVPALAPGTLIFVQASGTPPSGITRLSNSVALVVR